VSRYEPLAPGDHERIIGPRGLLLRPINASDIPNVFRWLHDPEVAQWWGDPPESEAACAEDELETDVNPCWRFILCEDGRDVGYIQYWHMYADTDTTGGPASTSTSASPTPAIADSAPRPCGPCSTTSSR
jgi:hypothetical protein